MYSLSNNSQKFKCHTSCRTNGRQYIIHNCDVFTFKVVMYLLKLQITSVRKWHR